LSFNDEVPSFNAESLRVTVEAANFNADFGSLTVEASGEDFASAKIFVLKKSHRLLLREAVQRAGQPARPRRNLCSIAAQNISSSVRSGIKIQRQAAKSPRRKAFD